MKQMTRQQVGRVAERARMILLSHQGRSIQEIAATFGCSDKTVRSWINRYESEGCNGLLDKPRTGRPGIVDEKVKTAIEKDMKKLPVDFGYIAAFWTVGLLCIDLVKTTGIKVSKSTVRRCRCLRISVVQLFTLPQTEIFPTPLWRAWMAVRPFL